MIVLKIGELIAIETSDQSTKSSFSLAKLVTILQTTFHQRKKAALSYHSAGFREKIQLISQTKTKVLIIMRTLEETVTIVSKKNSEILMCILISHIWKEFNKKPIRVRIITNAMVNEFFDSVIVFLILRLFYVSGILNVYFWSRKPLKIAHQYHVYLVVLGFVGLFALSILVRQCYQLGTYINIFQY